jgi:hypothetical protein
MAFIRAIAFAVLLPLAVAGCSGASSGPASGADDGGDGEPTRGVSLPREVPGGEMIMGLSVPRIADMEDAKADPVKAASEMDRDDILARADEAMKAGRVDEAVSFGDVLLLMFPSDPEALEIRGRALMEQGDEDGGRSDLIRCCESGRESCCD